MDDNARDNALDDDSVDVDNIESALRSPAPEKKEAPKLPDKFQGKSPEEIVEMYRNLESTLGKQSNELGELRKYNQMLLETQQRSIAPTQNTPPAEKEEEEEIDWYQDPERAVNKVVNKRLSKIEQMLQEQQKKELLQNLQQRHSDVREVVQTPAFQQWITQDQLRARLWQEGDRNYDIDKIAFLIDQYKQATAPKEDTVKDSSKNDVSKAITETGVSREAPPPGRTIRHVDIQNLRARDPNRYKELLPEIEQAYREGRVVR